MKGSFSDRSPWLQFLMLVFLGLGGLLFFTSVGIMLSSLFYPYSVAEVMERSSGMSGWADTELLKFLQGFTTLGTFLIPGLLGAYFFSEKPSEYLGADRFPNKGGIVILLVVLMTLGGTTISDALYRLSSSFEWPEFLGFLKEMVERTEEMMSEQIRAFLQMDSFGDFLEVFFLLGVLPAVCEETLFRGALQPVLKKGFGSVHLGVWVTAFLFALLHNQFTTFLSIFALGGVLGYMREWSRSIWVPVIMHLINNGSIVVAIYFWDVSYQDVNDLSGSWQLELAIPGMILFAVCLYGLYRIFKKQQSQAEQ